MTAKIISIANQKGGVGKTTTTSELGELLTKYLGKKVLLIDIDPQASLTSIKYSMHEVANDDFPNMTDVMLQNDTIEDIIVPIKPNLDLAPATLKLSDAELNLVNTTLRELVLEKSIGEVKENYDYILIDCPPSRSLLTVNALSASDYVMIPVQSEYQSLLGMQLLRQTIRNVKRQIKPNLKEWGYIITMVTPTNHAKDSITQIEDDDLDVLGIIPRAIDVADASIGNLSTYEYNKDNKAGLAYLKLAKKITKL